jgi:hypothetical protein
MLIPPDGRLKSSDGSFVLASGLPDGGADDDLEDLIFSESRRLRRSNVLVSDPIGIRDDFGCQRAQRFGERAVIECRPTIGGGRFARAFQDSGGQRFACLSDIRNGKLSHA